MPIWKNSKDWIHNFYHEWISKRVSSFVLDFGHHHCPVLLAFILEVNIKINSHISKLLNPCFWFRLEPRTLWNILHQYIGAEIVGANDFCNTTFKHLQLNRKIIVYFSDKPCQNGSHKPCGISCLNSWSCIRKRERRAQWCPVATFPCRQKLWTAFLYCKSKPQSKYPIHL